MNAENTPKKRLYLVITILFPIIFFLLLELGLRLFNYGEDYPLFQPVANQAGWLETNPNVVKRFYSNPENAAKVQISPVYFKADKPKDSFRIVVQGGSTAAGYPYGRWGGLAGMLNDRLEATFPDREIEVITTAMSAVNSYTMLDFVDEIIDIQPDAVLIYAGHNEFIGIMGVGTSLSSAEARGTTLLYLKLRKLRLYQLVQSVMNLFSAAPIDQAATGEARKTLMAKAAAGQLISKDSDTFALGEQQLAGNLDLILSKYAEAGIPVMVGTLASNEKDQAPFVSEPERLSDNGKMLQQQLQNALTNQQLDELSELTKQYPSSAEAWYAYAQATLATGDAKLARERFVIAKDLDQMRFRAPESFNKIIRTAALKHQATLVDVNQHLAAESKDGIIGDELMLEHLHPNAEGYFLLADAYYEVLKSQQLIGTWGNQLTREQAASEMPITEVDRVVADFKIKQLKANYPFTDTPYDVEFPKPWHPVIELARQKVEKEKSWVEIMSELLTFYQQTDQLDKGAVVARMLAQASPTNSGNNLSAGMLLMFKGEYQRSLRYLLRSAELNPNNADTWTGLAYSRIGLGQKQLALRAIERLERLRGNPDTINELKQQVSRL
ncbi:hypothetical protein EZV61_04185 [Corallincola luteus]|uniref:SGNH hydrolase-type esterase domain-containing protein n=1 Tax=Corallincola luteus TaxID=1775177 RepID=A0ABY2AQG5_9GAMM|nr:hypothetical protein [Corallincola luteus]TCI05169.1 hypothetical protein EZV61_04185 [Corallincola luteus]